MWLHTFSYSSLIPLRKVVVVARFCHCCRHELPMDDSLAPQPLDEPEAELELFSPEMDTTDDDEATLRSLLMRRA